MNVLVWAGGVLAVLTYFPMWKGIRSGVVKQNLFTWVLWGLVDGIAAGSIIAQSGSFFLPAAYTIGSAVTAFLIIKSGNKASWTWFETLIALLVVVSIGVWYFSGNKIATIASTMAMAIAGIPQLIDAWKRPREMPFLVFVSWSIANGLCAAGGKSWSIEERFYPVSATVLCLLVTVFSARKLWRK